MIRRTEDSMPEPLLSLRNLRVQFGAFVAVDDVSIELQAGELLGLIGPNGAGKTTTLRAAAGLQPPTTGEVRVHGHDVFAAPELAGHHLGFTPDNPPAYDALTVEDFLKFIAGCYKLDKRLAGERIDHWLEALWLTDKRTSKISSLSRGMKQRLGVARTLLPDPSVILLDEPAAGLDPAGRVHFRLLLASLRDQGKALIVSSHILADLAEYCTHVAIMGGGRIVEQGSVAAISGAQDTQRAHYRVLLASRVGDLDARLAELPDVRVVQADGDVLTLDYASPRSAAAELLGKLVAAGLPVAEFRALAPDLEQAYLRTGIRQVD
jgi:ABC-2 type transport system ATP-binding protein